MPLARRLAPLAPLALAALLALPLAAQTTPASTAAPVSLPLVVRDHRGQIVTTLTKDDLTLTEDGKPQTILSLDRSGDQPLTIGLLIDVSPSVASRLEDARTASQTFLDKMLHPADKAFVIQFAREVDLLCNPTAAHTTLQSALAHLESMPRQRASTDSDDSRAAPRPVTQLYDAVFLAADEVVKPLPNRKALILLTDGVDSGSLEPLLSAIESAQRADTVVYAIYIPAEQHRERESGNGRSTGSGGWPGGGLPGTGGGWPGSGRGGQGAPGGNDSRTEQPRADGRKALERITQQTGGAVFDVSKHDSFAAIYEQIAGELRSQLSLVYLPPVHDGVCFHDLSVTAKDKKLAVQARAGYYSDK